MKNMNVIEAKHICFYPERLNSGIGRVNLNLAKAMLAKGVKVDFILTKREGTLVDQIPEGVRVIEGKGSVLKSLGTLYHYLRTEQPQAIVTAHTHVNLASTFVAKLVRGSTQVMLTIHTATSRDDKAGKSLRKRIYRTLSRFIYPLADHVVAVSSPVADDLATYIGMNRENIQVIYNPVVTQDLFEKAQQKAVHPFFESEGPTLVAVGRLTEQKDYPTVLKAMSLLSDKRSKLIVLGEGEDREKLEHLIRTLGLEGRVDLHGFVANPYAFMKQADAFVLSSAWEGLPTVLIEALALGTPVVATDSPGGSAEILEEGRYGLLTAVGDSKAFAEAIEKTLHSPKLTDALKARGLSFSDTASADEYLKSLSLNAPKEAVYAYQKVKHVG